MDRKRRRDRARALRLALLFASAGCQGLPLVPETPLQVADLVSQETLDPTPQGIPPRPEPPEPVPDAEIDARLLAVGREAPPGLPAAQVAQRERERSAHLGQLRTWMAEGLGVRERLYAWLDGPDAFRWAVAARAAGRLGLYDLAPMLVPALEDELSPIRQLAARRALHELYGRWFVTREEVQPYVDNVRDGEGTRLLVAGLRKEEALARRRLFEALAHSPDDAVAWLNDRDPEVRAGVAALIGGRLGDPELDTAGLLQALFERLETERDPAAFHAALEAVLVAFAAAPLDAPLLPRLRQILQRSVAEPDLRSVSVARAFARVPWSVAEPNGPDGYLFAVEQLGQLIASSLSRETVGERSDSDAVVAKLQALQILCDRVRAEGLTSELKNNHARDPIFALLRDPERIDVVRAAAVRALEPVVLPEDWVVLVSELMQAGDSPSIAHALIGTLRTILFEMEGDSDEAREILEHISLLAGAADPDLRRRALKLFAEDRLQEHVRALDPSFLVTRLEGEEIPDLKLTLLGLLGRFGTPEMLDALMDSERFVELATGEPGDITALTSALANLTVGRPFAAFEAASRLAAIPHKASRIARTRRALSLVAGVDEGSLRDLDPDEHRRICAWAWELHDKGAVLAESTASGLDFLERLAALHLPAAERAAPASGALPEAARYHLQAVVLAELSYVRENETAKTAIEGAFTKAIEFAPAVGVDDFGPRVLRDRARYRARAGDPREALKDFRGLVSVGILDTSDLREAVSLLERIGGVGDAGRKATAPESFQLLEQLVRQSTWTSDPAALRLKDLEGMGESAILSESPAFMRRFLHLFEGLPLEPVTEEAAPSPAAWVGLVRKPEHHARLVAMRDRVNLALEASQPEQAEVSNG